MEVGETGAGGLSCNFFSFFWCNGKCMSAFGWTLCSLSSDHIERHAGRSAEFALNFSSLRKIIARLTRRPPICLETLVVVRMSSQKLCRRVSLGQRTSAGAERGDPLRWPWGRCRAGCWALGGCGHWGVAGAGWIRQWGSAVRVRGDRAAAPQGSLIDRSLFFGFPTTKLPKVTFEFLSVSSEGVMVLWRRDLVCVCFELNEEETGTGCFLLNTPVKFCCGLFSSRGMLLFIKKCSLFCHCLCFMCNELVLFVERFLSLTLMADPAQGCTSIPVSALLANPRSSSPPMASVQLRAAFPFSGKEL